MSKWIPSLVAALTPVLVALISPLQAAVAGNVIVSSIVVAVAAIVGHLLPSPVAKKAE